MSLSRRDMFRGLVDPTLWQRQSRRIPLPYTADPSALRQTCLECRSDSDAPPPCLTSCPEDIIVLGEDGTPHLDLMHSGCTFCGDCATACSHDALLPESGPRISARIALDQGTCLAWLGTMCQSCADRCEEKAIRFERLMKPILDTDCCTRCGWCVGACPVQSIEIRV